MGGVLGSEDAVAGVFEAAVEGFSGAVRRGGAVEGGEDVSGPLSQSAAEVLGSVTTVGTQMLRVSMTACMRVCGPLRVRGLDRPAIVFR